jgi:hypothetical protein
VLYRLPELLKADPSEPVFVVEGEKDVETLRRHNLLATTNAGGAGKWKKESLFNQPLRGCHVVILPDNDEPGRQHAEAVRSILATITASVHIVKLPGLPVKGDVSDWFKQGYSRELLLAQLPTRQSDQPKVGNVGIVGNVGRRKRSYLLPAFSPFPVDSLPPTLKEYVVAAASAIGCDVSLVAVPPLAVVSGAIGNARAILLKRGWVEPPIVWSATVADSGGHKSPAFHAAVNPLVELQVDLAEDYRDLLEQHARRGKEGTKPTRPPSHVTSDTTIETLGELIRNAPKGLLVARDELDGWFTSFTRYKGKSGGSDRASWLELHRAGALIVDRLSRDQGGLIVRRACASVTGTIQPAVLARALDEESLQAGLGARFLMAMPPKAKRVWSEQEISDDQVDRYQRLLIELLTLKLKDDRKRGPHVLGLSIVAKERWRSFFDEWGQVQHTAEGEQASAYAKIEAYAARLALIHHVVSHVASGVTDITAVLESSMAAGITLARWFASEATRIYAMLHECEEDRQSRKLMEWIHSNASPINSLPGRSGVTVKALQQSNSRRWPTADDAECGLDALVTMGAGEWHQDPPRATGGRTRRWFVIIAPTSDVSDDFSEDELEDESDDCSNAKNGQAGCDRSTANGKATYVGKSVSGHKQSSETSDVGSEIGDAWEGPGS